MFVQTLFRTALPAITKRQPFFSSFILVDTGVNIVQLF